MKLFSPHGLFIGSFIPNTLMASDLIGATAKLLWARLAQHAGKRGYCWPKQEVLALEIGVSVDTIKRALAELVDNEFIFVQKPEGKHRLNHMPNRYYFIDNPVLQTRNFRMDEVPYQEDEETDETDYANYRTPGGADLHSPQVAPLHSPHSVNLHSRLSTEKVKVKRLKTYLGKTHKNAVESETEIVNTPHKSRRTIPAGVAPPILNTPQSDEFVIPQKFSDSPAFMEAWEGFVECRRRNRKPMSIHSKTRNMNKLLKYSVEIAIEALNNSTDSDYQGVFPESIASKRKGFEPRAAHKNTEVAGKYSKVPVITIDNSI